jgi:hypothetical protein
VEEVLTSWTEKFGLRGTPGCSWTVQLYFSKEYEFY